MPRAALMRPAWAGAALLALATATLAAGPAGRSLDPHLDPALLPAGCVTCHRGHGVARSPMLPGPQRETCLACHGTRADSERQVRLGRLAPDASPALLASALARPHAHRLDPRALSEREPGLVTCSSCHAPHRGDRERRDGRFPPGRRLLSPKDPSQFEYQLCLGCHGRGAAASTSLVDIGRRIDPRNPSYHPIMAPSRDGAPSLPPELQGREVNCSDCHGNSDPAGARGPHGSAEPFLLRARYATTDGAGGTASAHALCYQCHRLEALLASTRFPEHGDHVTRLQASCATCHDPHGSPRNRALIRFGEEVFVAGVTPSITNGRLEFLSDGPGSGSCSLTCHGRDHADEPYGARRDPTRRDRP